MKGAFFKGEQGFTFIELMVAVSILSLAMVMLAQSNLLSLDVHARYTNRVNIQNWAEEKIWETQQGIFETDPPKTGESSGQTNIKNKDYNWKLNVTGDDSGEIFFINLDLNWKEGHGETLTSRSAYVFKKKQE